MLTVNWTILPPCPYSNPSLPITLHGNRDFADVGFFFFWVMLMDPGSSQSPSQSKAGLGWSEDAGGGLGGE